MRVLLSWLREFAPDIDGDPVDIGEKLSALGLAVEDMTITGGGLEGIVLAKVLDLSPHPDADKIQIVQVDAGGGEAMQVCCGAFNMTVGDLIPFATIGTMMPNGMEIGQRKIRGQLSNGMCCAASEIGLGDDSDGIMILNGRTAENHLGAPIAEALGIETDVLWDLEVNANRPDAMSVAGVARDLAAGLGIPFAFPDFSSRHSGVGSVADITNVEILDPVLCGRFVGRVLRGITIGTSPAWIANRLTALGMRPINSVVDLSNYVMLELGQPNHTYDLAELPGGHLRVRRAHNGEKIVTLDGVDRTLVSSDGVIANAADVAIGIAGVMGGESTEISDTTTDVMVEMAWWDPPSISRTVKRLNLPSEASGRFRRGADWGVNIDRACDRFIQLAVESGVVSPEGVVGGQIEVAGQVPDQTPIRVRSAKVNGLLGTSLSADDMSRHLSSIGFVADIAGDDLDVTVPTWRWDTTTETDIAEEVGRMHGYANIERTVPRGAQTGALTRYQLDRRLVREVLVGAGCDETQPMPFLAPGDLGKARLPDAGITLANPLVADESVLRTSLLPGQLKAIAYNQSHRGPDVSFFEIDHVFLPSRPDEVLPDEREYLAVALAGREAGDAVAVLALLDRALSLPNLQLRPATPSGLHPTRSAEIVVAGRVRGVVGEVAFDVAQAFGVSGRVGWLEIDLGALLDGPHGNRKYQSVSKYPSSDVDLAFEVPDDVQSARVEGSIRKAGGKLLTQVSLFDVYRGAGLPDGMRSLTYRLRFQAVDHTLTDSEVAEARKACIDMVAKQQGAALRA